MIVPKPPNVITQRFMLLLAFQRDKKFFPLRVIWGLSRLIVDEMIGGKRR